MKYVVEERGIPWFKEEVERRIGRKLPNPHDIRFEDVCDHLGWYEQPDGRWFLGISVENGRIHDIERPASTKHTSNGNPPKSLALRSGLRALLSHYGGSLRITPQQNLLLCDIAESDRAGVERVLHEHGVVFEPATLGIHRYAMACPALPTCGLALTDAERTLPSIIDQVQDILNELGAGDERLSVRMTGCPNGCARPYMGDIGIVGRSLNLYDIFIGGDWENTRLNRVAFPKVKSADLIGTLRPAIENWLRERDAHETFGDYYHRVGFNALPSQAVASAL
jgi:sulfite reductase (ferredoxin)